MNYIIEDNIDFFKELNNELKNGIIHDDNICLISNLPLTDNYITLNCNHKFNLLPLYNEVCKQKVEINKLEISYLLINQIKCPYCRSINEKLLPFVPGTSMEVKRGVNYPFRYSLNIHSCEWKIRSGKNKNMKCGKSAFKSECGIYCNFHHKKITFNKNNDVCVFTLNQNKNLNNNPKKNIDEYDDEKKKYIQISKSYTVLDLKKILRDNNLKVSGKKMELIKRLVKENLI